MPRSACPRGDARSLVTAGLWETLPPDGQQPHGVRESRPGEWGVGGDLPSEAAGEGAGGVQDHGVPGRRRDSSAQARALDSETGPGWA